MQEYRQDPIVGDWGIIASERGGRPMRTLPEPVTPPPEDCPFCVGSEFQTPHEVFADRKANSAPDAPGWNVRVVPNRYPAVTPDVRWTPKPQGMGQSGPGAGRPER